jgi:hypothetical protein
MDLKTFLIVNSTSIAVAPKTISLYHSEISSKNSKLLISNCKVLQHNLWKKLLMLEELANTN